MSLTATPPQAGNPAKQDSFLSKLKRIFRSDLKLLKNMVKEIKLILKSIAVAFSMYSRIPMPRFIWESDDMRYHLIFFPWVGAVIGLLELIWFLIVNAAGIGAVAASLIGTAIPLLVTGGFHVDGFMDTIDAISSYREKEERLKILSDPHIGAFAVIGVIIYYLLYIAGYSEIVTKAQMAAFAGTFFISRTLSGLCVMQLPNAKNKGMLNTSSDMADKGKVNLWLLIELGIGTVLMILFGGIYGLAAMVTAELVLVWFRQMSLKKFGGITGDLAGYFLTVAEIAMLLVIAVISVAISWRH